jgi:hypothetical protein
MVVSSEHVWRWNWRLGWSLVIEAGAGRISP